MYLLREEAVTEMASGPADASTREPIKSVCVAKAAASRDVVPRLSKVAVSDATPGFCPSKILPDFTIKRMVTVGLRSSSMMKRRSPFGSVMSLNSGNEAAGAGPGDGFCDRSTAAFAVEGRTAASIALNEAAASRGDIWRMEGEIFERGLGRGGIGALTWLLEGETEGCNGLFL